MAHNVKLESLSVPDLVQLIADAEARRAEKMDQAKRDLLSEIEGKAASLGLSLEGLPQSGASKPSRKRAAPQRAAGASVPAKYCGPNGEEWSGRGRPPAWIARQESEGRRRDDFLIG